MRTPLSTLLLVSLPFAVAAQNPEAEALFAQHCAACHLNPVEDDIPTRAAMGTLAPNAIVESLTEGTMRLQGEPLTTVQRIAIAELLTGRPVLAASVQLDRGLCTAAEPFGGIEQGPAWNGWGPDARNTRHQANAGGITAANVGDLTLKWAFGIADVTQSRAQPAIVGGRLFMGSQTGVIYALDPETGCTHWTYKAQSGVRTAISVGPVGPESAPTGYAIYFADAQARAYAVDAATGQELWVRKVDDHRAARATGAPTLHAGRLYVVTSGVSEESAAAMPDYECCTFRGSLTSLDATTGEVVWKTYTVDEPRRRGTSTTGKPLWGPAGAPIWSAPTVDEHRGLIYAATGNAYADPAPRTSDAIVAFEIGTGRIRWINQIMPDVWILGCGAPPEGAPGGAAAPAEDNPNCPEDVGPDFDFSASPALVRLANGRDALVVTQKSGVAYLLDPARRGREIWEYRWGRGSPVGGVWGATVDGTQAYFAVADQLTPSPGGLHAVTLTTGQRAWFTPPPAPVCAPGPGCSPAQSAALTSIPGVVFSGSADGAVRAYASDDGRILWTFDTNRDFTTVNGVKADGGSIDGPGPVVAGGMVYVTAGNAGFVGTPGNVLLAFGLE
jgi:polyvinyl alcohol dehydrogenase (cytochrome)